MTAELAALREGVEVLAARPVATAPPESHDALAARVEKLERRVRKLRRQADWRA